MGRKKITLAWIADDVARRNAFRKKRYGLLKKIKEFTTLCGVAACAVVYGSHDPEPEVWPNVPEATLMLQSFQELPEITKRKKMVSHETFLEEKLTNTIQRYQRLENQIQEMENNILIYEFMAGRRDMGELDLQEARKVYYIAGSGLKVGCEKMEHAMTEQGSSSEYVNYLPLINKDCHLDEAIALYINESMFQNRNQMFSLSFNYQNQLCAPNFNQQFMIQDDYAENQNQMMNDQMIHNQADTRSIVGTSSENKAIASNAYQRLIFVPYIHGPNQAPDVQNECQAMASSAGQVHRQMANMEDHL